MQNRSLLLQHQELMTGRWLTDMANTSAFIFSECKNLNWAGFYLLDNDCLYLGPFQGRPACSEIKMGKGVCGTAAMRREPIIVADVHEFPGHIACDPDSRSEIVIPMIHDGRLVGVLDVDSPLKARFSDSDRDLFSKIVEQTLKSYIIKK